MPLFEFDCADCGQAAEILVRGSEAPVCPHCSSPALARRISVPAPPAVGRSGPLPMSANCNPSLPPCGPGCCRLPN